MGFLSKVFSSIGVSTLSTVGTVLDDLTSSDEEMALTEIQKQKIQSVLTIRIKELMTQADKQAAEHEKNMESELTQRLQLDMKSDSWLSKNIRPMTLIFMTLVVSILSFATIFTGSLNKGQLETIGQWIPFFQGIMFTIYGFYFCSRGFEKIQKIQSSQTART